MDSATNNVDNFLQLMNFDKIFILVVSLLILGFLGRFLKFIAIVLGNSFPAKRILISQVQTVTSYFLYIVGGTYLVFTIIAPPKEMVVAVGGSAAVAIGFSLKDLVASIIAGIILIFDRPFQVGDRVKFNDEYGDIISIGLRAVRLQTLDDSTVTIPNSRFITDTVLSANMGRLSMQVETYFYMPINTETKAVSKILYEVAATSRFALLTKKIVVNVNEVLTENSVVFKFTVKAYIIDIHYESAFKTDLNNRSNKIFLESGIRG